MRTTAVVALAVAAMLLAGCAETPGATATPRPTTEITQWTPAPETPAPALTEAELEFAARYRAGGFDVPLSWSDRTIAQAGWTVCELFDEGWTPAEIDVALGEARFRDDAVELLLVEAPAVLCPEHADKTADGWSI